MPKILEATVKVQIKGVLIPLPSLLNNSVGGTFSDHGEKRTYAFRIADGKLVIGRTKVGYIFADGDAGHIWTEDEAAKYLETVEVLDKGWQRSLVTKFGPGVLIINPIYE